MRPSARGAANLRPRLGAPLRHRLARLAAAAHRFHRFAHHPLCAAYRGERLHVGRRTQVCAGCTWAVSGGLGGVACALLRPPGPAGLQMAAALQVAGLVGLFVTMQSHADRTKWLLRGAPTWCLAAGATWMVRSALHAARLPAWSIGIELVVACVAVLAAYRLRRRPPWRVPCTTCPQRHDAICDGWRRIVQRERALHRLTGRLSAAHIAPAGR